MKLLTSAAPEVMLALLTLTVSVCYIMLLRQESKTSAVSRDTLSPPSFSGGLERMESSLRPSAACPTCLTIKTVINQSASLSVQQLDSAQRKFASFHTIMSSALG